MSGRWNGLSLVTRSSSSLSRDDDVDDDDEEEDGADGVVTVPLMRRFLEDLPLAAWRNS